MSEPEARRRLDKSGKSGYPTNHCNCIRQLLDITRTSFLHTTTQNQQPTQQLSQQSQQLEHRHDASNDFTQQYDSRIQRPFQANLNQENPDGDTINPSVLQDTTIGGIYQIRLLYPYPTAYTMINF